LALGHSTIIASRAHPAQIETEFTWAEATVMNTIRVFLHDLLWQQNAIGFQKRIVGFSRPLKA